jgi:hypothetical protein
VGQGSENARSIARVRFATARAAVVHIAQHFPGVEHNLMASLALDVRDETHATRIMFVSGVVQTLLRGKRGEIFLVIHDT